MFPRFFRIGKNWFQVSSLCKTYRQVRSLDRTQIEARNSPNIFARDRRLVSQRYCKSRVCFFHSSASNPIPLGALHDLFLSLLFYLLSFCLKVFISFCFICFLIFSLSTLAGMLLSVGDARLRPQSGQLFGAIPRDPIFL